MSDRIAADFVYDRLTHVLPDNATREDAAWLLSKAKFRAGVSDEIRDLVLEMFEPEREPVAGKDYLPDDAALAASIIDSALAVGRAIVGPEPVRGVCTCGLCQRLAGDSR